MVVNLTGYTQEFFCIYNNRRSNNLVVSKIEVAWVKVWQHQNNHCVHGSVAVAEWWQFTEVTKAFSLLFCWCHFICQPCDPKFSSDQKRSFVVFMPGQKRIFEYV